MNIKIQDQEEVKSVKKNIILDGCIIGTIEEVTDLSFMLHAIIRSKCGDFSLYQGFGNTDDETLRNAIVQARELRQRELIELDELENRIWGDYETN